MRETLDHLDGLRNVRVAPNVSMAINTTWRVGGPAELMVTVSDEKSLSETLGLVREKNLDLFVLGKGSNLLVSDSGIAGVVLKLKGKFARATIEDEYVSAGGGAFLSSVSAKAMKAGLTGVEFLHGIPGTVGGAVMTNAGAFSASTASVLDEVTTLNEEGTTKTYVGFEDEHGRPLVPAGEIVVHAGFKLRKESRETVRKRMARMRETRRNTQPWRTRTAGSVFKNLPGGHAGKLIEECGLKGKVIGGARVSDVHANFIINDGKASASDIKNLIEVVKETVRESTGEELELEVQLVGFDGE